MTREEAISRLSVAMTNDLMTSPEKAAEFIRSTFSCGYAGLDEYDDQEIEAALLNLTGICVSIEGA